jgi:tetratricopeptide (TPR) repeat protein
MKASYGRLFQFGMFAIALQLIWVAPAAAQGARAIKVVVTDNNNNPVADASVELLDVKTNRNYTDLKTDKKGECTKALEQSGTFRIVVRKEGFAPAAKENVQSAYGRTVEASIKLEPGDAASPITVETAKPDIKIASIPKKPTPKPTTNVKSLIDSGVQFTKDGKFNEAVTAFTSALDADPKRPDILSNRANALIKLSKYNEAVADLDKAIDATNESKRDEFKKELANLYLQKGVALALNKKIDEADKIFKLGAEKAKDLNPTEAAQFHLNRGIILINNGLTDKAIEAFKEAIFLDSRCAEAYYQLGIALSAKPETFTEAIEMLNRYIPIGKNSDHLGVARDLIAALKKPAKSGK